MTLTDRFRLTVLGCVAIAAIVGMSFVPPIAQSQEYHVFADARTLLGVPNFWNVVSNVPFLVVGILGLMTVLRGAPGALPTQRWSYVIFFVGVALVGLGSSYYHWHPNNATLMWDRLPMSVAFMAFIAVMLAEHIKERVAQVAFWPLIVVGVSSVIYWDYTEALGRGDLRPYVLVQFLSLLLIAMLWLLFPSRLTGMGYLWCLLAGYVLAKLLEVLDRPIYTALDGRMAGHALKHLVAATSIYCFVLAVRRRRVVRADESLAVH